MTTATARTTALRRRQLALDWAAMAGILTATAAATVATAGVANTALGMAAAAFLASIVALIAHAQLNGSARYTPTPSSDSNLAELVADVADTIGINDVHVRVGDAVDGVHTAWVCPNVNEIFLDGDIAQLATTDPDAVRGCIAHELGHLTQRGNVAASYAWPATQFAIWTIAGTAAALTLNTLSTAATCIAVAFTASCCAATIRGAARRNGEHHADSVAADAGHSDGLARLLSADLERYGSAAHRRTSSHPALHTRLRALELATHAQHFTVDPAARAAAHPTTAVA